MKLVVTLSQTSSPPAPVRYTGWRGLHQKEGGRVVAYPGAPAVIPPIETIALPMTKEIQFMSWELMHRLNSNIAKDKWHILHGSAVAMNNGEQNGYNESVPHADFVNNLDLTASLPRYDKRQRTFQGTFIRGVLGYSLTVALQDTVRLFTQTVLAPRLIRFRQSFTDSNVIRCLPGVHGIDATKPMPGVDDIIKNNWFVIAVTAGEEIYNFPQGKGGWVVYPFIFDGPISFRREFFQEWDRDYLPDPMKTY